MVDYLCYQNGVVRMTEKINDWIGVIEKVNIHYQIAEFTLPCINIRVKCIDLETYNKLKKTLREFSEEEWGYLND